MKAITLLALVASLAVPACAQRAPSDGTTVAPKRATTVTVENNLIEPVRLFDGAFLISTTLSGQTSVGVLRMQGRRSLTLRITGGGVLRTEEYIFELNNAWRITIMPSGRVTVNLGR